MHRECELLTHKWGEYDWECQDEQLFRELLAEAGSGEKEKA
jgi:hypothetical protein